MEIANEAGKRLIRSREHLLHMLAEASELEHNLLCSYLYAAFSLKTDGTEELTNDEVLVVNRWRRQLMRVCIEEMGHLAQVANLMAAVGSRPHFDRPNLPVSPGYHPAGIQVALAPFSLDTLDHFIYLERPEGSNIQDAASFAVPTAKPRETEYGVLMPSAPDYATVGGFYGLLESGMEALAAEVGERNLFVGSKWSQLSSQEVNSPDLKVVSDLRSAKQAIQMVIVQGEGAPAEANASHFEAFKQVRSEYVRLIAGRSAFTPARNVARNPVMRRPLAENRVHVTSAAAAPVLDAANAVYSLMLRSLTATYDLDQGRAALRPVLVGLSFGLMHVLMQLSDVLTQLPANDEDGVNAGVTFAMLRSTEGFGPDVEVRALLGQRLSRILDELPRLSMSERTRSSIVENLRKLGVSLEG